MMSRHEEDGADRAQVLRIKAEEARKKTVELLIIRSGQLVGAC